MCRSEPRVEPAFAEQQKPLEPKPRSNPFGAARPREEVLKEKGLLPGSNAPAANDISTTQPSQGVQVELDTAAEENRITPEASGKEDRKEARSGCFALALNYTVGIVFLENTTIGAP